jgi:hypothetical protein
MIFSKSVFRKLSKYIEWEENERDDKIHFTKGLLSKNMAFFYGELSDKVPLEKIDSPLEEIKEVRECYIKEDIDFILKLKPTNIYWLPSPKGDDKCLVFQFDNKYLIQAPQSETNWDGEAIELWNGEGYMFKNPARRPIKELLRVCIRFFTKRCDSCKYLDEDTCGHYCDMFDEIRKKNARICRDFLDLND